MLSRGNKAVALIFALLIVLVSTVTAHAQATRYAIDRWTVDNGGGVSSGGLYKLEGTAGQHDAAVLRSDKYMLSGGFWGGNVPERRVYLPNIKR